MAFPAVGWDNGRVTVPGGVVDCPTMAALNTELNKYESGGGNAGDAVKLYLSGAVGSYGPWGIDNYQGSGSNRLEIYGRADGSTQVRDGDPSRSEASGSVFRLKDCKNVSVYNLDFDCGGVLDTDDGTSSGFIVGGAYDTDPNRGDCENIVIQGCRVKNARQSGMKIDGDGGTDNVLVHQCTVTNTGLNSTALLVGGKANGYGEIMYCGDGNTGRAYNDVTISQCHLFTNQIGEGINTKRNGTNVSIVGNLIHDIQIGNGGAIACEEFVTVSGNRIYDYRVVADSDTGFPHGIAFEAGGLVENNIVWTTEVNSTCLRTDPEGNSATVTARHNTFFVNGGRAVYALNEFGSADQATVAVNNAYQGTPSSGTNGAGGSINDDTATFVGPTSGTADAGDGPGSGFLVTGGNARNAASTLTVTTDIEGNTRTTPTDSGAYDGDGGTPPTVFEITFPVDASTGVDVDAITTTGTCPALTTDVQVRITDDDQTEAYNGTTYVADVDPDTNWLDAVVVGETFSYGPFDQPPSTNMSIDIRRM